MKSYKKILSAILAGAMLLGLTGCGTASFSGSSKDKSSSTEKVEYKKVRIGSPGYDSYPVLENLKLARDKGFLEEELNAVGYTAEFSAFQEAGPAINEAYASKAIDIAIYGDLPAVTAYSNGVKIKVFGVANNQWNQGVLVSKNSGISTPKDLEGKKVIVGIGTNFHEYWQHLVKEYNIDESKVELINVVSDASSVFTTGEADAWLTLYYNVVFYENQGLGIDMENTIAHPEMAGLWFATGREDYLAENPEVPTAILKAMKRSKEHTIEHPDEFFEAISSPTLGVDVFKEAYGFDNTFSFLNYGIDDAVEEKLKFTANYLVSNGFVKNEIDLSGFIDKSYTEKLN